MAPIVLVHVVLQEVCKTLGFRALLERLGLLLVRA